MLLLELFQLTLAAGRVIDAAEAIAALVYISVLPCFIPHLQTRPIAS